MKVIILCGGLGTRLSSLISDRPKPLASIAGKPFLEHIINWLVRYDHRDVIFSLHHKASQIKEFVGDGKRFGINATFCIEKEALGTGGAVKLAASKLKASDEQVIIVNGDTLFNLNLVNLFEFHLANESFVTIGLSHVLDTSRYGEIHIDSKRRITSFGVKQTSDTVRAGLVNGGVYMFSKEAIKQLKNFDTKFSLENDFFSKIISQQPVYGYISDITHYDIGTPSGYRKTDRLLSGHEEIVVRSRAPLRVSFGGGGTDVPPFDKRNGGCVLSCTINKYVYGSLKLRNDKKIRLISSDYRLSVVYDDVKNLKNDGHMDLIKAIIKRINIEYGFELQVRSEVPSQSGMGSSASLCTAVIGLFNHLLVENKMTKPQIAELAFKVETEDLNNPGGRQDQYAAVYGGFNFFEFLGDDFVKISPLNLPRATLLELEKNVVLAYIGKRGISGKSHSSMKISLNKKTKYLESIKNLGFESHQALMRQDLNRFGSLLEETWILKKKAFPGSSSKYIDKLYFAAKKAGAIGGRVTGAGGGGHMVFYCKNGTEHQVSKDLEKLGARILDFSFDREGLQVWEI